MLSAIEICLRGRTLLKTLCSVDGCEFCLVILVSLLRRPPSSVDFVICESHYFDIPLFVQDELDIFHSKCVRLPVLGESAGKVDDRLDEFVSNIQKDILNIRVEFL